MLSLDPLEVRIVDFTESFPIRQKTMNSLRGTHPYFPKSYKWQDGNKVWDYYSLGVLVLEIVVTKDEFAEIED